MSQTISATKTSNSLWASYMHFLVGDSCEHNLKVWTNVTGANSEPTDESEDWVQSGVTSNLNSLAVGANAQNIRVSNAANDTNYIIISGTYEGPNPEKVESWSPNSIKRQVI